MRIELFYDVVSPYARAAFTCLRRWAPRWEAELVLRPFLLGGVMKATGNTPPAFLPARGLYMAKDLVRIGRYFDVTLLLPDDFPKATLGAMRVLTQVEEHANEHLAAASEAFFARCWDGGNVNVNDAAVQTAALLEAGIDEGTAARFVAGVSDPAVKARLMAITDEAVERGAFGAPTYFVRKDDSSEEEMFFGSDRIGMLAFLYDLPFDGPVPGRPATGSVVR